MQNIGVCFKLVGRQDENAVYLFPSLSSFSGLFSLFFLPPCVSFSFSCSVFVRLRPSSSVFFFFFFFFFFYPFCYTSTNGYHAEKIEFSISQPHKFRYSGLRINASSNQVFTSGFFCRLVVTIFAALNVSIQAILIHIVHPFAFAFYVFSFLFYIKWFILFRLFVCLFSSLKDPKITRRELVSVHSNGIVLSCQGMFLGQLLVEMSRQADSIVVLQLASLPDLGFVVSAINGLIAAHFQQCMFLFSLLFACFTLRLLLVLAFFWYSVWQIEGIRKKSCVRDVWSTR